MRRKIIYIINPISGAGSKERIQNIIAAETLRAGIPFRFIPSVANGDYSFLHDIISNEQITDIIIAGGDGTVSRVIDSLMKQPVQFGIIPTGSGNGLALGAGIPKSIRQALRIVFNNHPQPIDGFRINNRFACLLCGIGFDGKVAHDFAQSGRRGLVTYVKKVLSNFLSAKSYPFEIKINHKIFKTEAYFISIANSNQFGNNFTIAPKASLSDGLLDIVIITDQSRFTFLYHTILQASGLNALQGKENINENKSVVYFQTNEITVSNYKEAPMHIDGEPVEAEQKIHITVQPSCFQLLTPSTHL